MDRVNMFASAVLLSLLSLEVQLQEIVAGCRKDNLDNCSVIIENCVQSNSTVVQNLSTGRRFIQTFCASDCLMICNTSDRGPPSNVTVATKYTHVQDPNSYRSQCQVELHVKWMLPKSGVQFLTGFTMSLLSMDDGTRDCILLKFWQFDWTHCSPVAVFGFNGLRPSVTGEYILKVGCLPCCDFVYVPVRIDTENNCKVNTSPNQSNVSSPQQTIHLTTSSNSSTLLPPRYVAIIVAFVLSLGTFALFMIWIVHKRKRMRNNYVCIHMWSNLEENRCLLCSRQRLANFIPPTRNGHSAEDSRQTT